MKYRVIKEHVSHNTFPLEVIKDAKLKVGQRSSEKDGWENWIYCWDLEQGTEGWVPEELLSIEDDYGILLEDYSAKELNAEKGEIVEGFKEMNGWIWSAKIPTKDQGWVPKENLECI